MEWFGRARIQFTTAPKSLALKDNEGNTTSLLQVCRDTVPRCQLNPLLFNGHLQTVWTATAEHGPHVHYKRRIFEADHVQFKGTFAVDFVTAPSGDSDESLPPRTTYFSKEELANMGSDDSRPMLVILHGLTGGSHEVYLRYAIKSLIDEGKWEMCVVNSRGCAKSKITTGLFYNARATWDTRTVVKWLRKMYPNRPLFGLGFSLGANIITNYIAEEGVNCLFKAAVVISSPWNLEIGNKALKSTWIGHEIYLKTLGTSLRTLVENNKEEIQKYTDLDLSVLANVNYLYEFDRAYQCPAWGYPTEDAYYRDASSVDSLLAVRIPLLALNASDDPIAVNIGLPYNEATKNPYTVLCTTSLGGHLGWFELFGGRWHGKPVYNFLNHMAFEIDHSSIDTRASDVAYSTSVSTSEYSPLRRKLNVNLQA
ncbi:Alpha/Beta hydrolase protein [Xylaria bambusicola]|uniref:Alpha/Beta hydrolase protein n=1 Tax=Xylaria bambusicola TaxID=326684 RepID=UPI0020082AE5|nr:Alpha/Beta hydrolase protein [Xylaria bambusicola]KAI0525695.1 Alpha/Beta hydrolase protein [Xylaria bambusicola]